jgi:hypothetical protein
MANALKDAPLKKEKWSAEEAFLTQEFDTNRKYMFELATKNSRRDIPIVDVRERKEIHSDFKGYQNIVMSSQIVWKGQRCNIRYYDGCTTIFQAEQPQERETIDQLIKQTTRRFFANGRFGVYGDNRNLLLYLMACSWNVDSPFRTRTATAVFRSTDTVAQALEKESKIDAIGEAWQLAKNATEVKMKIHALYLGIPDIDYDSGNELSVSEIRVLYREKATQDPQYFIESYGNKAIEVKYYISKSLETGLIHNKQNPNKATWGKNNTEICDISGLKSNDSIADRLYEFSQSEDGEQFLVQLKALYN